MPPRSQALRWHEMTSSVCMDCKGRNGFVRMDLLTPAHDSSTIWALTAMTVLKQPAFDPYFRLPARTIILPLRQDYGSGSYGYGAGEGLC